ncbi:MAG: 4-alpha-glucanotransferase [Lachnospiraceae bacterium]|nr:4-alpha-glucanotransferase [Lachnospiraceae bacterium]
MRRSGILMPVSSLPGPYGIGTFSKEAYDFVDFLKAAGQTLWQILPLGPTGYGDSPYQAFSTFAGNPYFIDLEALIEEGLLTKEECDALDWGGSVEYVDYANLYRSKFKALRLAFSREKLEENEGFLAFIAQNYDWVLDYALFMAIKNAHNGACWTTWEEELLLRKESALEKYRAECMEDILFYEYTQYLFDKQWNALKAYANEAGIKIVGDVPIYVALDSTDIWANPELFQLDEKHMPLAVAGCPPDAFSETGQLWGNPLYRWEYHRETGYAWWIKRMKHSFALYDIVRIDHFRGFESYYSIPADADTAIKGVWEKGPGLELFKTIEAALGSQEVIAEDLGVLTPAVNKMLKDSGYPGMKVFQFGFYQDSDSAYLPHNQIENCVIYTGTHDNQTTLGWYQDLSAEDRAFLEEYAGITSWRNVCSKMIKQAMMSVSDTCMIPMQDYLELDDRARINEPGSLGDNWKWRMNPEVTSQYETLAERIHKLVKMFGREQTECEETAEKLCEGDAADTDAAASEALA